MKKKTKKTPKFKKNIKGFLLSEEGKISKKNVAKIGLSLLAIKTALGPGEAQASHSDSLMPHASSTTAAGHSAFQGHTSHDSTHSAGGWC